MTKAIPTYRITLTADEINDVVFDLQTFSINHQLSTTTKSALTKLQKKAFEDKIGAATPSYVQTGRVKPHSPTDLMAALSDSDSDHNKKPNLIVDRRGNPNELDLSIYTADQLSEAEFASADHLAQTGDKLPITHFLPKPVIVNDRRKSDEIDSNNKDDDSDLAAALLG